MPGYARLWAPLAATVLSWGGVFGAYGYVMWTVGRDTDDMLVAGWRSRDAGDMVGNLEKYRAGMERHGLTSGNYGVFSQGQDTALEERTKQLDELIARGKAVQTMDPTGDEYKRELRSLRIDLLKIPRITSGIFWQRYWWWVAVTIVVTVLAAYISFRD